MVRSAGARRDVGGGWGGGATSVRYTIWTTLGIYKEIVHHKAPAAHWKTQSFAVFSFLSSCLGTKALSRRKEVPASLDNLPLVLKSRFRNYHCWASVDRCSRFHTASPEFGLC